MDTVLKMNSGEYSSVILDIEGTVCPTSFVKDVLFPYFLTRVDEVVTENGDPKVETLIQQLRERGAEDVQETVRRLVAADVKDVALKQLQGHVWQRGYELGEIRAPVYVDAIRFITGSALPVYIYSSGSIKAQQLFFSHVGVEGSEGKMLDLTPKLAGYFDVSTAGSKTETGSYERILKAIGLEGRASEVLFVSDNPSELDAAKSVGMATRLALRSGNTPVENQHAYHTVEDFSEL